MDFIYFIYHATLYFYCYNNKTDDKNYLLILFFS